ncbi:Hypothetical predicted protein [Podarcis lilfordi]|uniref:Uncharacterized protein n=1 Tax=Podarcis lilfordi TaxID=74358 RepID=A0AA35NVH2_9SAUR|nr:Hypothetical predicted protein [Podarcis lilfordi]
MHCLATRLGSAAFRPEDSAGECFFSVATSKAAPAERRLLFPFLPFPRSGEEERNSLGLETCSYQQTTLLPLGFPSKPAEGSSPPSRTAEPGHV